MTIAEFLLTRISEDESEPYHRWDCDKFNVYNYGLNQGECDCGGPARTLAEAGAKRRIVEEHGPTFRFNRHSWGCGCGCNEKPEAGCSCGRRSCGTLTALAAVYADHPDYDEAWRP